MRAYVFWHYPKPEESDANKAIPSDGGRAKTEEYERAQIAFHDALASNPIHGFVRSYCFELDAIPWLASGGGYEDWYLIEDTSALEYLNVGAVTGARAESHHRAAARAAGGIAGLYKSVGDGGEVYGGTALWFRKPPGMRYETLFERLDPVRDKLWQRMLTLGPTPEFCLLQSGPAFVPPDWDTTLVVRRPVYPT